MATLFEPAVRDQLIARLATLTPETPAKWGKFTATKMVAHVNEAIRMAVGDLPVKPKRSNLRNAFGRWLGIYSPIPWPKGVPTAPELLARGNSESADLDAERKTFQELLAKVSARKGATQWPEHPIFGPMTEKDWGTLGSRHVNHHFTQFGI